MTVALADASPPPAKQFNCIEREIEKLPSIEYRGQTDRVTTLTCAGRRSAAGLGRATPHALSR